MGEIRSKNPVTNFWLALAMVLGVSGMAGWAGRFFPWESVFGYGDVMYRLIVLDPVTAVILSLWPDFLLNYPEWLADYIVICLSMFILINVTWRNTMGRTLIAESFKDTGPIGGPIFLAFSFILTPIILPFVLFIYESLNHEGKTQVREQLKHYALMAAITAGMAAVNFLLKLS